MKLYREVETLQQRRHPSIISLLGSYYLETFESDDYFKTLHLLFPWAELDLASWMTRKHVPRNLENVSMHERHLYLYRSIYGLVSGLSYLHKEFQGMTTAHHDLKPKNILVVDGQFKIADFGRSHLRLTTDGSATGDATEVGTFEYRPPEYWRKDGTRAEISHGRAFDVWALGCIIIELATIIVYGWETGELSKFRSRRMHNQNMDHGIPELAPNETDDSFCNNWIVVEAWITKLNNHDTSSQMKGVLSVVLQMMAFVPRNRLYMWEAEMDLHEILSPHDDLIPTIDKKALCAQAPILDNTLDTIHTVGESLNKQWSMIPDMTDTPLHRAARRADIVRVVQLWALGWYLFMRDPDGDTPLNILGRSDNECLRELENNVTKLLEAAENDDVQLIRSLCTNQKLHPAMVDRHGVSAIHVALKFGRVRAMNCLLETDPLLQMLVLDRTSGLLPLHTAAKFGFVEGLKRILKQFLDVDMPSRAPNALYDFERYSTALYLAAAHGKVEAAKILIAHGAHLHSPSLRKDATGYPTPLHAAAERSNHEMLALLLGVKDAYKCLERRDAWGLTPLLSALRAGHLPSFEVLLQHGASIHAVSSDGISAVHYLAEYGYHDTLQQHINEFSEAELTAFAEDEERLFMFAEHNFRKEFVEVLKRRLRFLRSSANTTSNGPNSLITSRDTLKRLKGFFKNMF